MLYLHICVFKSETKYHGSSSKRVVGRCNWLCYECNWLWFECL